MLTSVSDEALPKDQQDHEGPSRTELLRQLDRIVSSSHFKNSKRYPSFLRFIVERTVEDNTEVLKERNLGTAVFGRPSDYDTNADPIVRVTAGEVRKRIAQYYQTAGHEDELRIDLPLGSYVPHFYAVQRVAPEAVSPDAVLISDQGAGASATVSPLAEDHALVQPIAATPPPASRFRWPSWHLAWRAGIYVMALVGLVLSAFLGVSAVRGRFRAAGTDYFWRAFSSPSSPALIVIGVHFIDSAGKSIPAQSRAASVQNENQSALASMESSDMVPLSDIVSYSRLTDLLTRRSLAYTTKSSVDTTLEELRPGPVLLLGGFNNLWTMRLTSALRFRFVPRGPNVNAIMDSQHPASLWAFDNLQPAIGNSRDYAIVASYYDTTIEQHVVIAAGIGKTGTIAAAEFLTTEHEMKDWLAEQHLPANKNIEVVLETDVLDGQPGPPHVIGSATW